MNDLKNDQIVIALVKAQDRTAFGVAFCNALRNAPEDARIPDKLFDEGYIKNAGQALYDCIYAEKRKRKTPSKFKHSLKAEANRFERKEDWRKTNPELAKFFADFFFDKTTNDVPSGKRGNRLGASRSIERCYVDLAIETWNDFWFSRGRPEKVNELLKPGYKPRDGVGLRVGKPSEERSLLLKVVLAAAEYRNRTLDTKKIKRAIGERYRTACRLSAEDEPSSRAN